MGDDSDSTTATAVPDYFRDPAVLQDPFSYFAQMREQCPVAREPHQHTFMVTGYDALTDLLTRKCVVNCRGRRMLSALTGSATPITARC